MSATQRVAVVTGGNRGIGRETARQLARQRLHVVIAGRDGAACEKTAGELRAELSTSTSILSHRLDVADPESVEAFAAWIQNNLKRIDVLVNNAGVYLDGDSAALALPDDVLRQTLEVNLYGPLRLCRAFVPGMIERGYGRVVNVSSGYGSVERMSGGGPAAYKISKAAVNALTRIIAGEAGGNVKVNSVDPGWVRTRMGGDGAPRSVEEGADTVVWGATLPEDGPTGGFFYNRKPRAW
jgi:NAD(P)-dependent dehydrogenase (short-subunit alcohol dehydrogenase family)